MNEVKKEKKGNTNRRKGHRAEVYYVNKFKELGFKFCVTARLGSRLHDNAKIDLINLPFNIQIKTGVQKNMNPGRELFAMKNMIVALFPPGESVHNRPCFVIHKKQGTQGIKRTDKDELVYMSMQQFQSYREKNNKVRYLFEKKFKFALDSEFRHVVVLTFVEFEKEIVKKLYVENNNNS